MSAARRMDAYEGFEAHPLDAAQVVWTGRLPTELIPSCEAFEHLWALHPSDYHRIRMGGRWVQTPRWQQAYGADYRYTGNINRALTVPPSLAPFLQYAQSVVDPRMNGLLLNWYAAELGHYIGRHRDKAADLIVGAPIVTISLGASRTFRLRPWKDKGRTDFTLHDGSVVLIPFETNKTWTHEVPLFAADAGRRISVTIRAFKSAATHEGG